METKTIRAAIAVVICAAVALQSYGALLYSYDFDEIGENGLVLAGANKGCGTGVMTLKQNGGGESAPYVAYGAQCSPYAFCSNNKGNSLWLGTSSASLGCGTDKGFTISFWVKTTASHAQYANFFGFRVGGYNYRLEYPSDSNSSFNICCNVDSGGAYDSGTTSLATTGKWCHVAIVFKGSDNFLTYVNGKLTLAMRLAGTGDLRQIFVGQTVLRHGTTQRCYPNNSSPTGTAIDDLNVYDAPFTVEQVNELATCRRRTVPVLWHFDVGSTSGTRGVQPVNSGTSTYSTYKWNASVNNAGDNDYANHAAGVLGSAQCFWVGRVSNTKKSKYWASFRIDGSAADGIGATAGSGFTFSFWLKAGSDMADWRSLFGWTLGSENLRFAWNNTSPATLYAYANAVSAAALPAAKRTVNEWQHVCAVWNRAESKMDVYCDGERVSQFAYGSTPTATTAVKMMMFGAYVPDSNSYWNYYNTGEHAYVDEAAFFNYSLSSNEVAWLGTRLPALPPMDTTNLVRTASSSGAWGGGLASWNVNEWDAENEVWTTTVRTVSWPACEDGPVEATLTLADGVEITNDTIVTPKRLALSAATSAALPVAAALHSAKGSVFAPRSLEVSDGLQLTVPLYAVDVSGTLTLGTGSKIVFDVSNFYDGGTTNALTVGAFALPAGETSADLLSYFGVTDNRYALSLSADCKTVFVAADTVPVVATWTGAGDGTSLDSAANWECRNASGGIVPDALPWENARVVISSGTAAMNAPVGTTIPWQYQSLEAGSVTLPSNIDWRGLPSVAIPAGVTVNLGGHNLSLNNAITGKGTITDTAAGGELHIDVASGKTFENQVSTTLSTTSLALSGSLKLVKEGAGTFVSSRAQTYTGGTSVTAGTVQPHNAPAQDNTTYSGDNIKAFGTNTISVASNAVFDVRGNYAFYGLARLEGGTLANSGPYDMTKGTWGGSGISALTEDSTLNIPYSLVFQSKTGCNLGGHTLTVPLGNGKYWYVHDTSFTNGVVDIVSGGWFYVVTATDASTVDFRVNCALNLAAQLDVRDYEASYAANYNNGSAAINVHGTFKPSIHDYFHGCKILDGSTIDLSSRTNALPLVSTFTDGAKTLSFETNKTVYVKFGSRKVSRGEPIISWAAKPADIDTVKFKPVPGERACSFSKKDDGLYITRGIMILVR